MKNKIWLINRVFLAVGVFAWMGLMSMIKSWIF